MGFHIKNGIIHFDGEGYLPETVEINASVNNYAIPFNKSIKINNTSGGSINITGLSIDETTYEHSCYIKNVSANDIVLKHNDTGSSAGNRFIFLDGLDITLVQGETISIIRQNDTSGNGWFKFS